MNEIEHLKQQRKAREDCVPWFEPTPREAALYFLKQWSIEWDWQQMEREAEEHCDEILDEQVYQ